MTFDVGVLLCVVRRCRGALRVVGSAAVCPVSGEALCVLVAALFEYE